MYFFKDGGGGYNVRSDCSKMKISGVLGSERKAYLFDGRMWSPFFLFSWCFCLATGAVFAPN